VITFITSVRHPYNCNGSFDDVRGLLAQTLHSIMSQGAPDHRIIVVAGAPFAPPVVDDRITYVEVDFPPPSTARTASFGMPDLRIDRGGKYLIGLIAAKRLGTDHVMFVDADDYVSDRLAAHSAAQPQAPGWFLDRGYLYDRGRAELGVLDDFHLLCGTSHVVAGHLLPTPADLPLDAAYDTVLSSVPRDYLVRILGSHRWIAGHLAAAGTPLAPLPFLGAVYHVGHGENHTARSGTLVVRPCPLSEPVRREFGIPPTLRTSAETVAR